MKPKAKVRSLFKLPVGAKPDSNVLQEAFDECPNEKQAKGIELQKQEKARQEAATCAATR